MTLIPTLTFTDYEWFPWSICNGCGMPAGNAYPSGHLVPSPILGLANAPIVETKFLELAMSLLDFSPRIPLGTFSILLFYALFIIETLFSKLFSLAELFQRFWNKISQKISTRLARHHIQRFSASDAAASTQSTFCTS